MGILVRGLYVILAIVCVVLLFLLTRWILSMVGIAVPENILQVIFIVVALIAIIGALTGKFDNWWT